MRIEQFVAKSIGGWKSMRSSHSLAFKHFEEVTSEITIQELPYKDEAVVALLEKNNYLEKKHLAPFKVSWKSTSDWDPPEDRTLTKGSNILIPIPESIENGEILRSAGYAEKIESISKYHFLSDNTFVLNSQYESSSVEERIWFASQNVRCRSSIIKGLNTSSIVQISFASEIRII